MSREIPEEVIRQLAAALEDGNKIEALKIYRSATGLGLKESKEEVERLHADLHAKDPERYPQMAGPRVMLFLGFLAAVLVGSVLYHLLKGN